MNILSYMGLDCYELFETFATWATHLDRLPREIDFGNDRALYWSRVSHAIVVTIAISYYLNGLRSPYCCLYRFCAVPYWYPQCNDKSVVRYGATPDHKSRSCKLLRPKITRHMRGAISWISCVTELSVKLQWMSCGCHWGRNANRACWNRISYVYWPVVNNLNSW